MSSNFLRYTLVCTFWEFGPVSMQLSISFCCNCLPLQYSFVIETWYFPSKDGSTTFAMPNDLGNVFKWVRNELHIFQLICWCLVSSMGSQIHDWEVSLYNPLLLNRWRKLPGSIYFIKSGNIPSTIQWVEFGKAGVYATSHLVGEDKAYFRKISTLQIEWNYLFYILWAHILKFI